METDANTDAEVIEPDSSSEPELEAIVDDDGFVSTTEFRAIEEVEPDGEDTAEEPAQKNEKPESDDKDFSQHPRFKELIKQKNDAQALAKAYGERMARLEAQGKPQGKNGKLFNYNDVLSLPHDDLMERFSEDAPGLLREYGIQVAHDTIAYMQNQQRQQQQQMTQKQMQDRELSTMRSFFQDKDDGIQMLQDGTIQNFMKQNPGHNPMSAYYALVGDKIYQSKLQAELKREREKIEKQLKAAGRAAPVRSQTASKSYADPDPTPASNKSDLKQAMLKRALSR
jgi:hypothetical protein